MVQRQKSNSGREQFTARLLKALENKGIKRHGSAKRLAEITHVSPKAASKWVNAESMPGHDNLRAIAEFLSVSPAWLEYGTTTAAPPEESAGSKVPLIAKSDISLMIAGDSVESSESPAFLTAIKAHMNGSDRTFAYIEDMPSIASRITPGKTIVLIDPERKPGPDGGTFLFQVKASGAYLVGMVEQTPAGWIMSFQNTAPGWEPVRVEENQIIGKVLATYDQDSITL